MRPEIHVGVVVDASPKADVDALLAFAARLVGDVEPELESATGARWAFSMEDPAHLSDDKPRRPSDFLDPASLHMVEGPFDLVIVITDVALTARGRRVVAGLASRIAQVAVISTRKLLVSPRGRPSRPLDAPATRYNAAALLLHLVGHMMGLRPEPDPATAMAPFRFDEARSEVPRFSGRARSALRARVGRLPQREHVGERWTGTLAFHLSAIGRHPGQVFKPLLRNRAPFLALSMPGLVTAALLPTFILVFTAEIWDVGVNMTSSAAWIFAIASILSATWYLTVVQDLFFPRKEKRVVTEQMAVINSSIFITMLLAVIGLFGMVAGLMLLIEYYIFPANLISEWPTLEDPQVVFSDKLRIASIISATGVITGALAGGLASRAVIRHLALFREEP